MNARRPVFSRRTAVVTAVGATMTGCSSSESNKGPVWVNRTGLPSDSASTGASTSTVASTSTSSQENGGAVGPVPAGFAELEAGLQGAIGLAWVPVGGGRATSAGRWVSGVAWSTSKVPVAVAAIRAGHTLDSNMTAAITASDNEAAEAMWAALGPPDQAAAATTAVLRDCGDSATTVPSTRRLPGFSIFGQTIWSLVDQAQFAARLPCLQGADQVLALMGRVVSDQRWGLGTTGLTAQFKGGWGPSGPTGFEVRQFGVLTLADQSQVGVAIASAPADGTMAGGTHNLTAIARWLVTKGDISGGRCR